MKREVDIVVLSDVHLGSYSCHAKELLNYLKSIKIGTLILNGDFINLSPFNKKSFPKQHAQVIQKILELGAKGTKVYYITGNHDDVLRKYSNFESNNIHLRDSLQLQLKGKSYWLFHGDIFDFSLKYSPFFLKLGGRSYEWLIKINRLINKIRAFWGMPKMSFSKRIKKAVNYTQKFEDAAIQAALEKECDYVICGHVHQPQMRTVEQDGKKVTYLNSGDWVENLTALEYKWNRWSIYEYDEADYELINPKLHVKEKSTSFYALVPNH